MKHIAIIMDGNRRFGKKNQISASTAYESGANKIKEVCSWVKELNISFLTLFAFSSENWKRNKEEISILTTLLETFLDRETQNLINDRIKVKIIGDTSIYKQSIVKKIQYLEEKTKNFSDFTLLIALNYGGRAEIINAINKILQSKVQNIDESVFKEYLYTKDIPDPDLLIRTGGNHRLSNFLIWQTCYTEIFFTNTLWPEFSKSNLLEGIEFFNKQQRNFGL